MPASPPDLRAQYAQFVVIDTRWADNDAYGHVNNVVYYSYFDTAVNRWLIDRNLLDIADSPVVGLVAETGCRYFAPLAFPDQVTVGLRVTHLGTTSVRYALAIFRNDQQEASAMGHFVHVYVDRQTRRPAPIPLPTREALATLITG